LNQRDTCEILMDFHLWGCMMSDSVLVKQKSALKNDVDYLPMARSVIAINHLGIRRHCAAAIRLFGRCAGSPL